MYINRFYLHLAADLAVLSNSIYEKFIALDDEKILKTIRKLFIIYQRSNRKSTLHYFLKWRLTAQTAQTMQKIKHSGTTKNIPHEDFFKNTPNSKSSNIANPSEENTKFRVEDVTSTNPCSISIERENQEIISKSLISHPRANICNNSTLVRKSIPNDVHLKLYNERFRREITKAEIEKGFRKEEVRECTFTPKINKKSYSAVAAKSEDRCTRLYEKRIEKENKLRQLNIEKEMRINQEFTFEPKFSSNYKLKTKNKDFYIRLKEYSAAKSQKIKKIKSEIEQNLPQAINNKQTMHTSLSQSDLTRNYARNFSNYHRNKEQKMRRIEENMLKVNKIG